MKNVIKEVFQDVGAIVPGADQLFPNLSAEDPRDTLGCV